MVCKTCLIPPDCIYEEPEEGFMPTLTIIHRCSRCRASVSTSILLDLDPQKPADQKRSPLMVLAIKAQEWIELRERNYQSWREQFGMTDPNRRHHYP